MIYHSLLYIDLLKACYHSGENIEVSPAKSASFAALMGSMVYATVWHIRNLKNTAGCSFEEVLDKVLILCYFHGLFFQVTCLSEVSLDTENFHILDLTPTMK